MDGPMERMPIACVHCAKAKAKCDKKVPCSRCVAKQIYCQSRPTRRSTSMAFRRHNATKPRPGSVQASPPYNFSDFSPHGRNPAMSAGEPDLDFLGLLNRAPTLASPGRVNGAISRHALSNVDYSHLFGSGPAPFDPEPPLCHNAFSESPPELSVSITPIDQDGPRLEDLMSNFDDWDPSTCDPIVSMGSEGDLSAVFDMVTTFENLASPDVSKMPARSAEDGRGPTALSVAPFPAPEMAPETACPMEIDSGPVQMPSAPPSSGVPDALLRSQESWPFFGCDRVAKVDVFPPKTATFYVEGLVRVLRAHDWQVASTLDPVDTSLIGPGAFLSHQPDTAAAQAPETLSTVTRTIVQKACTTHCAERDLINRKSMLAQAHDDGGEMQLPPRDIMHHFVQSYIRHHEPYYVCAPDLQQGGLPLLQSNVQASHLLLLLAMAQGAAYNPTSAARYLASGLIEACRLFLFDSIEKEILLSREPIILKSALLFTVASAWSGDNWHMDIAMGQRGMYTSMLAHARMLNGRGQQLTREEVRSGSEKVWRKWRELEERKRIAYSWVMVDQELSLFSDTAPQLEVSGLQAAIPSADRLWRAASAKEWSSLYSSAVGDERLDGISLRDLFTSFVEGDLGDSAARLTPLHLRLLLHPLQTLICQLRQFLNCLPDSGRRRIGTSMSRAATKARLEEISALLHQWHQLARAHADCEGNARWTMTANLLMYHLISLNTRTSMGFIEQFARGEVPCGSARQASQWLQGHCLDDVPRVLGHCGQIFRLVKSIPRRSRPPWWSGAVYRAGLVAWATSVSSSGGGMPLDKTADTDKPLAIDALDTEHAALQHYLQYREGVPMLSDSSGKLVAMSKPNNVLEYCVALLEEDLSTRVTEGIARKLRGLANTWKHSPIAAAAKR